MRQRSRWQRVEIAKAGGRTLTRPLVWAIWEAGGFSPLEVRPCLMGAGQSTGFCPQTDVRNHRKLFHSGCLAAASQAA
jgi:hypothetical protein